MLSSGFINRYDQIEKMTQDNERWTVSVVLKDYKFDADSVFKGMYTSGCGQRSLFYTALDLAQRGKRTLTSLETIHRNHVNRLMEDFQTMSVGFKETGGCILLTWLIGITFFCFVKLSAGIIR